MAARRAVLLAPFALALSSPCAWAQVPSSFPYVGRLAYDSGAPAHGMHDISVALYTTPTPSPGVDVPAYGPCIFDDTSVVGGIFAIVIGECGPNPGALTSVFSDFGEVWLAFEVDGQSLNPLQKVYSVPYALRAGDAASLDGTPASEFVVWSDLDGLDAEYVLKSGDTVTGDLDVEGALSASSLSVTGNAAVSGGICVGCTNPAADLDVAGTVRAPIFGRRRSWGTLAPGESIGININGLSAVNGNVGFVVAHLGANQDTAWSDSAYVLMVHAHGGPYNDFTPLASRTPAGGYSISGGSITTFTNNSGTTARYVIRYLDILRNHSEFLE